MKKKIIIMSVIVAILVILGFIVICNKKTGNAKKISNKEENTVNDEFKYDYDELTGIYTIYDDNGNVRGIVDNEFDLEIFRCDKDFNREDAPPGMY